MSARPSSSNSAATQSLQSPRVVERDVQSIAFRPLPATPSTPFPASSSSTPGTSSHTAPGRSRRRSGIACNFDHGDATKKLAGRRPWNPTDEHKSRGFRARLSTSRPNWRSKRPPSMDQLGAPEVHPADMSTMPGFSIFRQVEQKHPSREQLDNNVKDIYEGVTMIERKCIELISSPKTMIPEDRELSAEQYQKLIGLHETLLHEQYDFFLACQNSSAEAEIRLLPNTYNMPARMWRHGQSFLEFLRKRLPTSREHMLKFICKAYIIMTLLYETVPAFVSTWIGCLGHLGRYRMAIEDDGIRDREIWTSVSRHWYLKASDRSPEVGMFYHHLAMLARPDALQQLYYYNKSLCVPYSFPIALNSIMTLFDPVLERPSRLNAHEIFIRVHAILFSGRKHDELDSTMAEFLGALDRKIAEKNKEWLHPGYYIAISLICSLLGYGSPTNPLKQSIPAGQDDGSAALSNKFTTDDETAKKQFENTRAFVMKTCDIVFRRKSDINALPFFHTILVFLYYVAQHPRAIALIEDEFPWKRLVDVLNEAFPALLSKPRMANESFPRPLRNEPLCPLPEDYALRGFAFSKGYFPADWFSNEKLEDAEKMFEPPSLGDKRRQRLHWLGHQICSLGTWIKWNTGSSRYTTAEEDERRRQVSSTESPGGGKYPHCAAPADLRSRVSGGQTGSPAPSSSLRQPGVPATASQQAPMTKMSRSDFDETMIDRLNCQFCRR
ncbi:hypothetical protein BBAD15_g12300 [Beauveria bassiana D1-5]|uniref:DNA/RNA-binding domain-containing protein n=1 Tax=Beauveria bassiana D1-5 TaxID=1245745 RepID=A0A0A2V4T0_BEABA|nr:hypothetical protein BBAD15_g12300 [Beauveria bassiana D1-5]